MTACPDPVLDVTDESSMHETDAPVRRRRGA